MDIEEAILQLNRRVDELPIDDQPVEILKWTEHRWPGKWAQVTSFGMTGIVISHMMQRALPYSSAPLITIDTLHLFPETYALVARYRERLAPGRLHVYKTLEADTREDFERAFGSRLWRADPQAYDFVTKVSRAPSRLLAPSRAAARPLSPAAPPGAPLAARPRRGPSPGGTLPWSPRERAPAALSLMREGGEEAEAGAEQDGDSRPSPRSEESDK